MEVIKKIGKMKLVIFDLDGTLLDTSPGIVESVRFAADHLGLPQLSEEQLLSFVGPPLRVSFKMNYGCTDEEAEALTDAFRDKYREGAALNAVPYDGLYELCENLKRNGVLIGVATGKQHDFARQILEYFNFSRYIDILHGTDDAGRLTKADLLRMCAEDAGADPGECVLVGDTEYDAKGAAEAEIPFLAVTYGFGNPEEMKKWPCVGIADMPEEIFAMVINEEVQR